MNKIMIALTLSLMLAVLTEPANAKRAEFTASYDYYKTPNSGNNYDDGQGFTLGVQHDIVGKLDGRFEFSHITDIDFPEARDPKGSWGELRGYGVMYNLIYELPYNDKLGFDLGIGAGAFWWDFRENPWLQDRDVKVSVEPSAVFKARAGVKYQPKPNWSISLASGWWNTNISKDIQENKYGIDNILDADGNIGLQFIPVWFEVKNEF